MITHAKIKNFQSWKEVDIDFGRVTVFVGRGDAGKSAIVRALTYALFNETGGDFIRSGTTNTQVTLDIDDQQLVWGKPAKSGGHYTLGSLRFTKMAGAVPPEIQELTRVINIPIDKTTSIAPQIQQQFDRLFILSYPPAQIARILGKLSKLNVITLAEMRNKGAIRQLTTWAAQIKEEIDRLHKRQNILPDEDTLLIVQDALPVLDELLQRINQLRLATARVSRLQKELQQAQEEVAASQDKLCSAQQQYETALKEAGVCSTCPWI